MNIDCNRSERTPSQAFNDLVGTLSFEQGEAWAGHRPVELYLQVASGCNLDCPMCYEHLRPENQRRGRGLRSLDPEIFAKIEREIFPYSSRVTFGVGGEPMLCPDILEFIERSHAANQHVHLMTNGTKIGTDKVARTLVRCLSSMEISTDGATKETYEKIRVGAKFETFVENVKRLNRFRLSGDPEDKVHLTFCLVLMKSNVRELVRYVELAAELAVDRVAVWHVIPVTEEGRAETLYDVPELANEHLKAARERAVELGLEVDFVAPFGEAAAEEAAPSSRAETIERVRELDERGPREEPGEQDDEHAWSRPLAGAEPSATDGNGAAGAGNGAAAGARLHCHMPTLTSFVFWDGRVFPCCHPHAHTKLAMGDLREQSFLEIWNGRSWRNLRHGLAVGDPPPLCQRCTIMHGPAAADEGPEDVEATGADLAEYYGDRDLAPVAETRDVVEAGVANGLAERFATLDSERRQMLAHIETIEAENRERGSHIATIEAENDERGAHIATIEAENDAMKGHVRNLEKILTKIHGRSIYRLGCKVKDLFARR